MAVRRGFRRASVILPVLLWMFADAAAESCRDIPLDYGKAFGMTVRFKTQGGETPVLRVLWLKEIDTWRIAAYDVELP